MDEFTVNNNDCGFKNTVTTQKVPMDKHTNRQLTNTEDPLEFFFVEFWTSAFYLNYYAAIISLLNFSITGNMKSVLPIFTNADLENYGFEVLF